VHEKSEPRRIGCRISAIGRFEVGVRSVVGKWVSERRYEIVPVIGMLPIASGYMTQKLAEREWVDRDAEFVEEFMVDRITEEHEVGGVIGCPGNQT